jgi:hypothetical protein
VRQGLELHRGKRHTSLLTRLAETFLVVQLHGEFAAHGAFESRP